MRVSAASDLGPAALLAVAGGEVPSLSPALLAAVATRREEVLAALASGEPVYGVSTGMGALKGVALSPEDQAAQSSRLLVGRAVGGPPWLTGSETRAVVGVRLRTFLNLDAGVSPDLCAWLVALLGSGSLPSVPRTGSGAAGEIIPLAHAFASAPSLGVKEGVALLQGVPVATALSLLRAAEVSTLVRQWTSVTAAEIALVGASRDPYDVRLARGDEDLAVVLASLASPADAAPAHLQAPVSFRVAGAVLTQVVRAVTALDAAVLRALDGVTDSPAYVDGAFVGTAGFHGVDLAAACDGVRLALLHAAEVGTARLHRLLDSSFTGLPDQLSADPGPQAGLVAVHKRAVGVVHAVPRTFTSVGTVETSRGQEDVQSFALEACESLRVAVDAARDVVACETLAVHQGHLLAGRPPFVPSLPDTVEDRPWGRDVETLKELLADSWRPEA